MLYRLEDKIPKIDPSVFVAPDAQIIGDVTIGENSSIWFNTVIRGDVFPITIGKCVNIQDHSMVHVTANRFATIIGDNVTIGHRATIHGATLKEHAFVGMSATILDEAVVEEFGFVAAGALVSPRFVVPAKTLVAGVPAKIIRPLHDHEIEMIVKSAQNYVQNSRYFIQKLQVMK